jgi:hypothetical protein
MIDTDPLVSALQGRINKGSSFRPSEVDLSTPFVQAEKEEGEDQGESWVNEEWQKKTEYLTPKFPTGQNVIAIDATGLVLGYIPDGFVAAIRASLISKKPNENTHHLERHGPFLVAVTSENKDALYQALYRAVYGVSTTSQSPSLEHILDRIRNVFERFLQLEVAKRSKESLLLLDGSLIGGTVANPSFFVRKIIDTAAENRSSIAAMSKTTQLALEQSRRNILSLLEGVPGPCYVGDIRNHISQGTDRYLGDIYVTRLTTTGEPFRIDLPGNAPEPHGELLNAVAGLAGDYGYPEELKLAHMTCVFSAIEILELQAAAIALHGLVMKEEADIRPKIFPL